MVDPTKDSPWMKQAAVVNFNGNCDYTFRSVSSGFANQN